MGANICHHKKNRFYCKVCGWKNYCHHGLHRNKCKECRISKNFSDPFDGDYFADTTLVSCDSDPSDPFDLFNGDDFADTILVSCDSDPFDSNVSDHFDGDDFANPSGCNISDTSIVCDNFATPFGDNSANPFGGYDSDIFDGWKYPFFLRWTE
jgi:hypothetical protein